VATKVSAVEGSNIPEFLVRRTDAKDKQELGAQLKSWNSAGRLVHIFSPTRGNNNQQAGERVLSLLHAMTPSRIAGVNVSALYPPETNAHLTRMFAHVLQSIFDQKRGLSLTTLGEYDEKLALYTSEDFWQQFHRIVCGEDAAIGLLREFGVNPYNQALGECERGNAAARTAHIASLRERRQARVDDIEARTEARAREVMEILAPRSRGGDVVAFDFGYHPECHKQVCGAQFIGRLATDESEKEVVRQAYAGFISAHSHEQMMRFLERFRAVDAITSRQVILEESTGGCASSSAMASWVADAAIPLPIIARGYEDVCRRFIRGVLIYKQGTDEEVRLPISALADPLDGVFDLSGCGDTGNNISISTGYRQAINDDNSNKVEIWLAPWFLMRENIAGSAAHYAPIMAGWDGVSAPVGIFYNSGSWDNLGKFDHLTTKSMDTLGSANLYENWYHHAIYHARQAAICPTHIPRRGSIALSKVQKSSSRSYPSSHPDDHRSLSSFLKFHFEV
jgi:hypothetical protein